LEWRATAPCERDYTTFVHLLDEHGRIVAQTDSQPRDGRYPTSIWGPGEVVPDQYAIIVPPDLPPGEYGMVVGMYHLESGERLPVRSVAGTATGDSVELARIEVR